MKNISVLAKNYDVEQRNLIRNYSTELGRLKGGIIKCKLSDFYEFTEHPSVLDAVNNDYILAEKIIWEFLDGNRAAVIKDHFYVLKNDFYNLPYIDEILSPKDIISPYSRDNLIEILGPVAKRKLRKRKKLQRRGLTVEEDLLIKRERDLRNGSFSAFRCNIDDFDDFGWRKNLWGFVRRDVCLYRKILDRFDEDSSMSLAYNNVYVIDIWGFEVSKDKNGDKCLPPELALKIREFIEQNQ